MGVLYHGFDKLANKRLKLRHNLRFILKILHINQRLSDLSQMQLWFHALVEDVDDENLAVLFEIKHHMLFNGKAA